VEEVQYLLLQPSAMEVHSRDLRYFVAVAEEVHFTRAAERLFISQPALSKQIRALERALGADLFERSGREVRLTAVGAALLPRAQIVLREWDAAEDTVKPPQVCSAHLVPGDGRTPASSSTSARPEWQLSVWSRDRLLMVGVRARRYTGARHTGAALRLHYIKGTARGA
jgi:hypothetical protein